MRPSRLAAILLLLVLAVTVAAVHGSDTPEKFKPLVRKWKSDTREVATFEVTEVTPAGALVIKDYLVAGRSVPNASGTVTDQGGHLAVRIQLNQGYWDLTYSASFGGHLTGEFVWGGRNAYKGRFYEDK